MRRSVVGALAAATLLAACGIGIETASDPGRACPTGDGTHVTRWAGDDRIATAIVVAQRWTGADVVVVASSEDFPDALAGVPFAVAVDGPLLLTPGDGLPGEVGAELRRLAPRDIVLVGGVEALGGEVERGIRASLPTVRLQRIGGVDRYETAAMLARAVRGDHVAVVSGEDFPDALSAGAFSADVPTPILLTRRDRLPDTSRRAVGALAPATVTVVGGESAIGADVVAALTAEGFAPRRLAGDDRYGTSARVAAEVFGAVAPDAVVVASGAAFPDGLVSGAVAAHVGSVTALVPPDDLDRAPDVRDLLASETAVTCATIVGGVAAVTPAVVADLEALLGGRAPPPSPSPSPSPPPSPSPSPTPPAPVLVAAAGDIADCGIDGDERTAALLDDLDATVLTLGDNVYDDGTQAEFADCYDPTWGRHLARTRPAPGNHDYYTPGATGYYGYFGAAAGDPDEGWYSFDLGEDWHLVALNSNCDEVGGCGVGSPQESWLRADLAANRDRHVLAYWHHARFSSAAAHGDDPRTDALVRALADHGPGLVLAGHDHTYERFSPLDPDGTPDAAGSRFFVAGTGGPTRSQFDPPRPGSEVRIGGTAGVLLVTLRADGYDWEFRPADAGAPSDSGSQSLPSR